MSTFTTKVRTYYRHADSARKGYQWAERVIAEKAREPSKLPNIGRGYSNRYRAAYAVQSIAKQKRAYALPAHENVFWMGVEDRAVEVKADDTQENPTSRGVSMKSKAQDLDYADIQNGKGKSYKLVFLPYLETPDGRPAEATIGYEPAWSRRGRGYGRWEEFFRTLPEARKRMKFLIASRAIEDIELRTGGTFGHTLVDEWRDSER